MSTTLSASSHKHAQTYAGARNAFDYMSNDDDEMACSDDLFVSHNMSDINNFETQTEDV